MQLPATQRSQARVNVIGLEPVQVPAVALSVCPRVAVPEVVGGAVFKGGVGALGVAARTAELCGERATTEPAAFVAVTV